MPDTIRELVARLGFEADIAPATRFDSAIKRSKTGLEELNKVRLFGLTATLGKVFAAGSIFTGGLKSVFQFTEIERSLTALKRATKEGFEPVRQEIERILDDKILRNLIKEFDLVAAATAEAQKGVSGEDLVKFLRSASLLSVATNKNLKETFSLITGFVGPDADMGIFKLIGELPLELQELFKTLPGFAQAGIIARRQKLIDVLAAAIPELEESIIDLRKRGILESDRLGVAFDKLAVAVGEKGTTKIFQDLNNILIPFLEILTKLAKGEIGPADFAKGAAEKGKIQPDIIKTLFDSTVFKELFFGLIRQQALSPRNPRTTPRVSVGGVRQITPPGGVVQPDPEPTPGQAGINVTVEQTNHFGGGAGADTSAIRQAITEANQQSWGEIADQARRTTIKRGGP